MPPSAYRAGIRIDPVSAHHDLCSSRSNRHGPRAADEKRRPRRPGLGGRCLAVPRCRRATLFRLRYQSRDAPGLGFRETGAAAGRRHRPRCTAGNAVSVLQGGDEAYPAMLAAIRNARHSVALASYIFRDDAVGRSFIDALIDAQKRGVVVRVLIDGIGSGYVLSMTLQDLKAGGVPAARFLHTWVPWRMPFLNMRNHKKLLIVDGTVGFTGGLNIGAEHSLRLTAKDYIDGVQVRVEGPVTRQLMDTFARDWAFTTDEELGGDAWWPAIDFSGSVFARGIHSGPDTDMYKLETILGAALTQAHQRLQFAIAQAGLRGVVVEILIPERCDYFFMDWAMRAHLRFFEDVPATVYFTPSPFDHGKLMTVDGQWCLIGSSNWDTRSFRLNFEFDLECYDRATTANIDALIDQKLSQSHKVSADELAAPPRWTELRDAATRLLLPYL
jgi:cardiolipin synthase